MHLYVTVRFSVAVRRCYAKQVDTVRHLLGDDDAVRRWFGAGMLDNVVAVLGLAVRRRGARVFLADLPAASHREHHVGVAWKTDSRPFNRKVLPQQDPPSASLLAGHRW
ncbi:hypothetical protein ACIP79_03370 [Streptomyces sp. NPDC088747]|uniref:hypothetical protein n=1 Tax=Streptomyces sp. NPDC088747 TaxID=3365886 RepID=UPI0038258298